MQTENQAKKSTNYFKILKVDLVIHTVLAFLGIFVPIGIYFWGFSFSDKIIQSISNFVPSPAEEIQILAATLLFFSGIIGMLWQIISYFWQRKLREIWDSKRVLVRKITKFYYLAFLISFSLYIIIDVLVITVLSIFNFQRPVFLLPLENILAQVSGLLFQVSPIFWLIYYINLWRQLKILKKKTE